jgi:membrane-associated phospholipid phosphatase
MSFLKILSYIGSNSMFIWLFLVVHIFFSISNSFAFLCVVLFSNYLNNLMKIIYQNPRPFWIDTELKLSCNGGFGNPSGHSMRSAAIYLAFAHLITDKNFTSSRSLNVIWKSIIFSISIGLIIGIMLSRVYLGAHSINQIIFGSLLGIALYLFVFFILELQKVDRNTFFRFFVNMKKNLGLLCFYLVLIGIGILTWSVQRHNNNIYTNIVSEICPKIKEEKKFYNDGLHGILPINGMIGAHLGLMLLAYFIEKNYLFKMNYVNELYKGRFLHYIFRILLMLVFSLPFILTKIKLEDASLVGVFLFKISVPYLLTLFSLYGLFIYSSVYLSICNKRFNDNQEFLTDKESQYDTNEMNTVKVILKY